MAEINISILREIASVAGGRWADILSSSPSTLFALLVVLHFEEQKNLYSSVIYEFFSISTSLIFYISCWYLLPKLGLNLGLVAIYLISISYLFLLNKNKNIFIFFRLLFVNKQPVWGRVFLSLFHQMCL